MAPRFARPYVKTNKNDMTDAEARRSRDAPRRYDEEAKRVLIEACLRPGVSVARMAQEHGVNANLPHKWITRYMQEREEKRVTEATLSSSPAAVVIDSPPAFVPVVQASAAISVSPLRSSPSPSMTIVLHVRLPKRGQFDLGEAKLEELSTIVEMLGRLPCSDSTKG